MKSKALVLSAAALLHYTAVTATPIAVDSTNNVTYQGLVRNGIEVFLGIPFGQDTGGANRFKPPQPWAPPAGSLVDATAYGVACPQPVHESGVLSLTPVTNISEDCLNLNIARPSGVDAGAKLPVIAWIYGGGFSSGFNEEQSTAPDGMILESVQNGLPIIHVAMNYRLGVFGFAASKALLEEGSSNAGLRDQRLALEWVRDNIQYFGGDPNTVTIFGQSSGGLAVGMQIMAYGGAKPVPFERAIPESQFLEPGITGNFTRDAMQAVADLVGCNTTDLQSAETAACLRGLDVETLNNASIAVTSAQGDISHNVGDIWLPVMDGDFLPAAPSELIRSGRFANVTVLSGWTQDDVTFFTDINIATAEDTHDFIESYLPDLSSTNLEHLLSLYPVTEFTVNPSANLSSEFYRSATIFRDILMMCTAMWYGEAIAGKGNDVYHYDWNQTILTPRLEAISHTSGLGVIHTSEFAYIFGNLSHYDDGQEPFLPSSRDWALETRGTRSWSTFASLGRPGVVGKNTFQGFDVAFPANGTDGPFIFVAGGPNEGYYALDGPKSTETVERQRLRERCGFLNSDEVIAQMKF
ncbi:putative lipase [Mycena metata]|uniref:Carboxylic ester hydrolase n=1 Tax=Mycena metata TaxID=1033252 RepID=A0AAD7HZB5_9AGAR|nr:putative lipase [Mycena metata]